MDRDEIIREVNQLGLQDYVINAGSALVLYGVKEETRDLDISVSETEFSRLIDQGLKSDSVDNDRIVTGSVEIFKQWRYNVPTRIIAGLTVEVLDSVASWKKEMGREKDLADLKKISEYQRSSPSR